MNAPADNPAATPVESSGELSEAGTTGPPVVTLCGSMRFADLMLRVAARETARGVIVLAPFVVVATGDQDSALKAMLDDLHRRKIDMADRVVVVTDETGYWGASTAAEITYARRRGIPVTIRRVRTGGGSR
jgi:hypothetical protein